MRGLATGSAARAMLRLARRDAWRNRGRSALIAVMVALPVLCLSAVSVIYHSDQRDPQDWVTLRLGAQAQAWVRFGSLAEVMQTVDGSITSDSGKSSDLAGATSLGPAKTRLAELIPAPDRLVSDRSEYGDVQWNGRSISAQVREFDYPAAGAAGPVRQISGRAPRTDAEVVISQSLARREGLRSGDSLSPQSATGSAKSLTVVGVVAGYQLIGQAQVIGLPGSMLPADKGPLGGLPTWLVLGPAPVDAAQVLRLNRSGFTVTSRDVVSHRLPRSEREQFLGSGNELSRLPDLPVAGSSVSTVSVIGVLIVAFGLALLQVALLAGPAIAVGARRNERTLALLAASGGEPRQLRFAVLANAGLAGAVGCLLGAGLGAGLGAAVVPLVRRYGEKQVVSVHVQLLDLLVLVLVGTGTAIAAALVPARAAARMNVVDTLTGRRSLVTPRRLVPVLGVLTVLAGAAICFFGATREAAFITVAGIAVAEIGLVTITGTIVALCARLAGRLPFAARFALRDAVRQRGRTAPAVAAVMAAIAGTIAVGVFITAQDADGRTAYHQSMAAGTVDVQFDDRNDVPTQEAVMADLRRTLPIRQVAPYQGMNQERTMFTVQPYSKSTHAYSFPSITGLYSNRIRSGLVDDGTVLEILTGVPDPTARAALAAGKVVVYNSALFWPDGTVHFKVVRVNAHGTANAPREVSLPAVLSPRRPGLDVPILPESSLKSLGATQITGGVVADTSRIPTQREEQLASGSVATAGHSTLKLERGYRTRYPLGLLALVVAAAVVTLGGTFSAIGLAAAESRADVATLAAVGASPAVRRRLAAAQAGVITLLGGMFGLITGLLAGWTLVRLRPEYGWEANIHGPILEVPWGEVLSVAFGVPLLAIVLAYLTARSRLPLVRRLGQ